jgi:hypothetical protein
MLAVSTATNAGPTTQNFADLRSAVTKLSGRRGLLAAAGVVAVVAIGAGSCQQYNNSEFKPSDTEADFLARVKSARVAYPGSPMAEAHPDTLGEHLSWTWPDDETLVSQGNALCTVSKKYPSLMPFNQSADLPFLTNYSVSQASELWYAAANTLCPEQGADQYFKP